MDLRESLNILVAFLILSLVVSFSSLINETYSEIPKLIGFSAIILLLSISSQKFTANLFEAKAEHSIWSSHLRTGFKKQDQLKNPIPAGIIYPMLVSLFSLGSGKLMSILTYETTAKKYRSAKTFGTYSHTSMTDWHNALIGASGILAVILLSTITYFLPWNLESLSALAAFYAFWNLIPYSKLDGMQILMGSRTLWSILSSITLILTLYSLAI